MLWMAWRQHRLAVLSVTVAFCGTAAFFLLLGNKMRAELPIDVLPRCFSVASGPECGGWAQTVNDVLNLSVLLPVLAIVAGVFLGSPLLAREMEQRTNRFAWTRGVSRWRWLNTKLVMLGSTVVLLSTALSAAHMWWYGPATQTEGLFEVFGATAPVFPAVCLFAFVLGVFMGALTRRVLTAITLTTAGFLAFLVPVQAVLRPRYLPAVDGQYADARTGWVMDFLYTDGSGTYTLFSALRKAGLSSSGTSFGSKEIDQLKALGFRQFVSYQPADRFWTFQLIEAGIFTALAAACVALTFYLVRTRSA
ncbi:hypothetical protein [Allokutzneria albata]|uniref:ABC-2 family transporter protein n=1 Tax=Allokutzneria albata TaxID=211114 RepID=A0A1H0ARA3_ALLAB|nr:hypothetical protein [Allokutzneria albata]SDN36062.1 hypothetical protein SAMN04489726_6232 [Allokutzneria albata]